MRIFYLDEDRRVPDILRLSKVQKKGVIGIYSHSFFSALAFYYAALYPESVIFIEAEAPPPYNTKKWSIEKALFFEGNASKKRKEALETQGIPPGDSAVNPQSMLNFPGFRDAYHRMNPTLWFDFTQDHRQKVWGDRQLPKFPSKKWALFFISQFLIEISSNHTIFYKIMLFLNYFLRYYSAYINNKIGAIIMSFIRKKKNKDGKVYAYKVTSIWDPEKKQPRSISKYLGAVDADGNIIPSGEKQKICQWKNELKTTENEKLIQDFGDGYFVLESIKKSGIFPHIAKIFERYPELLLLMTYRICKPGAMYNCQLWLEGSVLSSLYKTEPKLSSQDISKILMYLGGKFQYSCRLKQNRFVLLNA